MYYLRKISRGRWPDENKILSATLEDIEAYCVINEFKPIDQNQISVWKVENEDDLTDALIALASNRERLDSVFAVTIPAEYLSRLEIEEQEGDSPTIGINDKHRCVSNLNYVTLGELIVAIIESLKDESNLCRRNKSKMREILKTAYDNNKLDIDKTKEWLKKELGIA